MHEARSMTNAEKCSVFLMESDTNELVAKVFDGDIADNMEVRVVISWPIKQPNESFRG